ncbi:hypothetical protein WMY93_002138 [Mugilogobius chulae]|uniref:Signal transducer and activator of transcription 4 n=1 Tax=Mugilogobius chulae TaxID=88201 RepID=A0AAW0Q2U1_9GOBI
MQEQGPLEKSLQSSVALERQKNIDNRVGLIRGSVQLMDQAVKFIEDMQDDFDFRYKTLQSRDQVERNSEHMKQEVTRLQEMLNRLDFKRKEVLSKMDIVVKEIDDVMNSQLYPELQDWKRRQQITAIGDLRSPASNNCRTEAPDGGEIKYLIYHLIKSSFLVEKQPCMPTHPQKPLIIKTGVQFTTKVRLLVKLPEVDYQLKVKTTFDKDLPPGRVRQFFILTNNTKVMDIEDYSNGCLSVEFRHLQLKEKKYINGTKGNEGLLSVTEELHSLNFEACFTVQGLTIDLETCSLPLVVISNVSQLPGGWASVMWYNLLTDEPKNLTFFANPPRANWTQLSEVLSWQFSAQAGRGLDKDQLTMLGEKLMGHHLSCSDYQVSWSKFSKENIQGKPFSFWMWLDSILELIKKHLLPVWSENYIMGFVSKETERTLLKTKNPGRFSFASVRVTSEESPSPGSTAETTVKSNSTRSFIQTSPKTRRWTTLQQPAQQSLSVHTVHTHPISEMRSSSSSSSSVISTPPPSQSPEPPMTPGEFNMLNEHLCFDIDTMTSPYSD